MRHKTVCLSQFQI